MRFTNLLWITSLAFQNISRLIGRVALLCPTWKFNNKFMCFCRPHTFRALIIHFYLQFTKQGRNFYSSKSLLTLFLRAKTQLSTHLFCTLQSPASCQINVTSFKNTFCIFKFEFNFSNYPKLYNGSSVSKCQVKEE